MAWRPRQCWSLVLARDNTVITAVAVQSNGFAAVIPPSRNRRGSGDRSIARNLQKKLSFRAVREICFFIHRKKTDFSPDETGFEMTSAMELRIGATCVSAAFSSHFADFNAANVRKAVSLPRG